jgi:hypothetical protein
MAGHYLSSPGIFCPSSYALNASGVIIPFFFAGVSTPVESLGSVQKGGMFR